MVRTRSRVRAPSSALDFLPQRHRGSIPFLSTVVLSCPQGEDGKSPVQESKMALYLEIGRPWGPSMVSRRSPVRTRASASFLLSDQARCAGSRACRPGAVEGLRPVLEKALLLDAGRDRRHGGSPPRS